MVAKRKTAKKAAAPKKTAAKKTKRTTTRKAVAKKEVAHASIRAPAGVGGWWGNSYTAEGVIIAMVSLIGIAAMFMGWLAFSASGWHFNFNGWSLLTACADCKKDLLNNSWQIVIPLITFILSIIAFIAIILPAFKVRTNPIATDVVVIICGLIMFILCICFLFGQVNVHIGPTLTYQTVDFLQRLGIGAMLTLVSSIVMILVGLTDAIKHGRA